MSMQYVQNVDYARCSHAQQHFIYMTHASEMLLMLGARSYLIPFAVKSAAGLRLTTSMKRPSKIHPFINIAIS